MNTPTDTRGTVGATPRNAWPTARGLRVEMHDSFLSGWGAAEGRVSVYCVECDTLEQAKLVAKNAKRRPEMKKNSVRLVESGASRFNPAKYHLSKVHFSGLSGPWLASE